MNIADEARRLFNRTGFGATSFRAVATELGISPGHLHYHFKTKEALLEALFQELVDATDAMFVAGVDPVGLPNAWFTLQRKYLFFFRELPAILLSYATIRRRYTEIARLRVRQFAVMFGRLRDVGLVLPEPELGFYERYALLLWHQCNSALSLVPPEGGALAHAQTLLRTLLLPLLTDTGRGIFAAAWGSHPKEEPI